MGQPDIPEAMVPLWREGVGEVERRDRGRRVNVGRRDGGKGLMRRGRMEAEMLISFNCDYVIRFSSD